jgi:hypothetical protein
MTGRWITAGLVALALAGCNKKEAAKPPPPPTTETTAPATPPTTTAPTTTTTTSTTTTTPPPPTTETPPPSGYTAAPSKYTAAPPAKDAKKEDAAAEEKIVKSKVQLKAERDVLGSWREQRKKVSVLRFTKDGWVSLQQGGKVRNGKWTADQDGAITATFSIDGGEAALTAHPTDGPTMAIVPSSKGPQIWPGYGQLIFQRG